MADTPIWDLEPHTAAKHALLRRYLGAWFPIMASSGRRGRIVFLDGFAGPGIYRDGQVGSPILALQTLIGHQQFDRWGRTEFVFAFFEPDPARYQSLLDQITLLGSSLESGIPGNIKIHTAMSTFEAATGDILDELGEGNLAPTFAFVDPFGFSGAPMDLLSRLLAYDSCEVFFNFIADHVVRFISHPDKHVLGHLERLFGSDEYEGASTLRGESRLRFLHDLYARQLREAGGFTYVCSFRMLNERGKTPCWLFYGTRQVAGLKKMKDAMWAVDPGGGVQFSDRLAGQEILFAGDRLDVGPLREAILDQFGGQTASVATIEQFVLVQTPYSASHYNQRVLKPLEDAGEIEVIESPRKRRGAFPPGTVIRFV